MADPKIRSRDVTDGMRRAPNRAMLRAVGMTDDDWEKPQVGVASSWNEVTPCNMPLDRLGSRRKRRRYAGRRFSDDVQHHCRERRHFHGSRRNARLACIARSHRRLGRSSYARRAVRWSGCSGRLRQVVSRHADGHCSPRLTGRVSLRRLDPSRPTSGPPRRSARHNFSVFEAVGACGAGLITEDELGEIERARVSKRRQLRRHVHRQHDGFYWRSAWHVVAGQRVGLRPLTRHVISSPFSVGGPSSACSKPAFARVRS